MKTWVKELRLTALRLDGGTQMRVLINQDVVADYAQKYRQKVLFPPIEVVYDGTHYWVWNGHHRHEARRVAGFTHIYAEVRRGSRRDAQFLALGANKTNGLQRTNADKQRAVLTMLRDPEWCHTPNTDVAQHVGVDDETVRKYRLQVVTELLATSRGQKLSDAAVYQQTGANAALIQKARAQLHQPPADSAETRNVLPATSVKGQQLEDILGELTAHQRAVYDGLDPDDQEAFLALARDEARESEVDALQRQQSGRMDGASGSRGGARIPAPDVLAREDQVELLVRQLRTLLERRDTCVKALKALEDFLGICRAEFAEWDKKKQLRMG